MECASMSTKAYQKWAAKPLARSMGDERDETAFSDGGARSLKIEIAICPMRKRDCDLLTCCVMAKSSQWFATQ